MAGPVAVVVEIDPHILSFPTVGACVVYPEQVDGL